MGLSSRPQRDRAAAQFYCMKPSTVIDGEQSTFFLSTKEATGAVAFL
jgi:hypothetical protein